MRLIDADELKAVYIPSEIEGFEKMMVPVEVVLQNIDDMPTVDAVTAIHGKWQTNRLDDAYYVCTVCKKVTRIPRYVGGMLYAYCPHCGARMDGKDGGNG